MNDDDKNAARDAIRELEDIGKSFDMEFGEYIAKLGFLAIAKTLWCIAITLAKINDKMKK